MLGVSFVDDNLIRAEAGTTGREVLQDYGISYFKENNMIVGSGVELPSQSLDAKYNFRSFHSTYITILAEGGILLMTAYTAIILATFSNMVRLFKKNREYGAFFIALLIAYLAYGLVESNILLRFDNNSFLITVYLVFIPAYLVNYYTRNAKLESQG
jgi:O-antigen ligase